MSKGEKKQGIGSHSPLFNNEAKNHCEEIKVGFLIVSYILLLKILIYL